jgi:hypothetical protein
MSAIEQRPAGPRRNDQSATSGQRFTWITAQIDGTEHAVTDEAQVAGMAARAGWYEAVCGNEFLAAFMDLGPSRACAACQTIIWARDELRSFEERLTEHRRPGWLARIFCRYPPPAPVDCVREGGMTSVSVPGPVHRRQRRLLT